MTTVKALYASTGSGTSITWSTAVSLGSGNAAGCAAIDNTTNLYIDASVYISVLLGAVAAPKYIHVWFAASEDGTNYTGNSGTADDYTGTDHQLAQLGTPPTFLGPFFHPTPTASVTTHIIIPSLLAVYGGIALPKKWGLIIENQTGAPFGNTVTAEYTGINLTNA
jgi:hypothetical protein